MEPKKRNNSRIFGELVRCSRCQEIKHKSMFYPSKRHGGISQWCKSCNSEVKRNRYIKCKKKDTRTYIKRIYENGLRCSSCQLVKPFEEFYRNISSPDGYSGECKYCSDIIRHNYPKRRYDIYKFSARKKHRVFDLTLEEFSFITSRPCFYCGEKTQDKNYVGIDRVDSSIGYVLSNCVPCCRACNAMKLDYSQQYFITHIKKIIKHIESINDSSCHL